MKTTRKTLCSLLMVSLCLAMLIPAASASADESSISLRYLVVTRFEAELGITSDGYSTCEGKSTTRSGYTADVTMELQQKKGNSWETIQTWTDSGRIITINKNWYVDPGYDYRVKLSAEVKSSSGTIIEKPVVYSTVQHY